jgi:hypothetical protein
MREFVRANHLAEPMRIALVQAFVLAGHALVAGGHHLPRVLLTGAERLAFFVRVTECALPTMIIRIFCSMSRARWWHYRSPSVVEDCITLVS